MPQIDIDFDVYKELTTRRSTEDVTYNDVIHGLLNWEPAKAEKHPANGRRPWVVRDTAFPEGSAFIADYKGKSYTGVVKDGKLVLSDGHKFSTPSAAAVHVTKTNVNGWRFWKCKLPSSSQYVLMERLRGKAH